MSTLKVFGSITTVLAILTAVISVWLLASSLILDCASYGYGYQFGSYSYGNRLGYGYGNGQYGRNYVSSLDYRRDRYDSRYTTTEEYYRRNRDLYCVEIVPNWITAAAIGISIGILQMLMSVVFIIRDKSKILTLIWSTFHFLFLAGIVAAFAVSCVAYVYEFHDVEWSGKLFLAILAINGIFSFLLPCIGCWKAINMGKNNERGFVYEDEPMKKPRSRNY